MGSGGEIEAIVKVLRVCMKSRWAPVCKAVFGLIKCALWRQAEAKQMPMSA